MWEHTVTLQNKHSWLLYCSFTCSSYNIVVKTSLSSIGTLPLANAYDILGYITAGAIHISFLIIPTLVMFMSGWPQFMGGNSLSEFIRPPPLNPSLKTSFQLAAPAVITTTETTNLCKHTRPLLLPGLPVPTSPLFVLFILLFHLVIILALWNGKYLCFPHVYNVFLIPNWDRQAPSK